jgi:hypothetical protein
MIQDRREIQNSIVYIQHEKNGTWSVTESDHRFGGIFGSPKAAMKFAREEAQQRLAAMVMAPTSTIKQFRRNASPPETAGWRRKNIAAPAKG